MRGPGGASCCNDASARARNAIGPAVAAARRRTATATRHRTATHANSAHDSAPLHAVQQHADGHTSRLAARPVQRLTRLSTRTACAV